MHNPTFYVPQIDESFILLTSAKITQADADPFHKTDVHLQTHAISAARLFLQKKRKTPVVEYVICMCEKSFHVPNKYINQAVGNCHPPDSINASATD